MIKKYHITTPIYYINDKPHIGHTYSTFTADTLARFYRLLGNEVFFSTGTDENSQKTVEAAKDYFEKEEVDIKEVQEYTDSMANIWKTTWDDIYITYDDFIRTTEKRHKDSVEKLYKKLKEKGLIYKGKYEGFYCWKCEAFYKESDVARDSDKDLVCPDHKMKLSFIEEENYFFKFSEFTDFLKDFLEKNKEFLCPDFRVQEIKNNFLEGGLEDISISRESKDWGIRFPDDENHVFYVWFEALINYISVLGYDGKSFDKFWNNGNIIHVLGKDILKFHALMWPAMLNGAGEKSPDSELVHGFFTVNGEKISKSLGNAINPVELIDTFGSDAVRYYLFTDLKLGSDGDFSYDRLKDIYTTNLLSGWGNLVNRVVKLSKKNNIESIELSDKDIEEIQSYIGNLKNENPLLKALFGKFDESIVYDYLKNYDFQSYIRDWFNLVQTANKYIDDVKPWETIKENPEKAKKDLSILLFFVKNISILSSPFLIEGFEKVKSILGIQELENIKTYETSRFDFSDVINKTSFCVSLNPDFLYKKIE